MHLHHFFAWNVMIQNQIHGCKKPLQHSNEIGQTKMNTQPREYRFEVKVPVPLNRLQEVHI